MEIIVRTAFLTEQIKIGTDVRSTFGTEFRTVIKKLDSEKSDRGSKLYSAACRFGRYGRTKKLGTS